MTQQQSQPKDHDAATKRIAEIDNKLKGGLSTEERKKLNMERAELQVQSEEAQAKEKEKKNL